MDLIRTQIRWLPPIKTGAHANLLKLLSDAIFAFQRDLEAMQLDKRVLGMTFLNLEEGSKEMTAMEQTTAQQLLCLCSVPKYSQES